MPLPLLFNFPIPPPFRCPRNNLLNHPILRDLHPSRQPTRPLTPGLPNRRISHHSHHAPPPLPPLPPPTPSHLHLPSRIQHIPQLPFLLCSLTRHPRFHPQFLNRRKPQMVRDKLPPQRAHQPRQILRRARGVPGGGGGLREMCRCERGERDAGRDCVVVDFQRGRGKAVEAWCCGKRAGGAW